MIYGPEVSTILGEAHRLIIGTYLERDVALKILNTTWKFVRNPLATTSSSSTEEETLDVMESEVDPEGNLFLFVGAELPRAEPLLF